MGYTGWGTVNRVIGREGFGSCTIASFRRGISQKRSWQLGHHGSETQSSQHVRRRASFPFGDPLLPDDEKYKELLRFTQTNHNVVSQKMFIENLYLGEELFYYNITFMTSLCCASFLWSTEKCSEGGKGRLLL